jgi:predicted protein tyrosine phosphatase
MKLTICGIPELGAHCAAGVTHVLSILDPGHPDPAAFDDFSAHRRFGLRFHDVIGPYGDDVVPRARDVAALLEFGREVEAAGPATHLLIHCHAGVSRSTASAALLLAQADPKRPVDDIFAEIGRMRPRAWPNILMLELGEEALRRPGDFVPAVAAQYRRALRVDPNFATYLVENGRGREVELARR